MHRSRESVPLDGDCAVMSGGSRAGEVQDDKNSAQPSSSYMDAERRQTVSGCASEWRGQITEAAKKLVVHGLVDGRVVRRVADPRSQGNDFLGVGGRPPDLNGSTGSDCRWTLVGA